MCCIQLNLTPPTCNMNGDFQIRSEEHKFLIRRFMHIFLRTNLQPALLVETGLKLRKELSLV